MSNDDDVDENYWRPNGCVQWALTLTALALHAVAQATADAASAVRDILRPGRDRA